MRNSKDKRRKQPRKKRYITLFAFSFFATIGLTFGVAWAFRQYVAPQLSRINILQNRDVVPFHTHYSLNPDIPTLVIDDRIVSTRTQWDRQNTFMPEGVGAEFLIPLVPPMIREVSGQPHPYLPMSFIQDYIDPFIFWDNGANHLFVSTRHELLRFTPNQGHFYINRVSLLQQDAQRMNLDAPVLRVDGETFLPASLIQQLYPLYVEYFPAYNMVVVTNLNDIQRAAIVQVSGSNVRHSPDNRAPIVSQLAQGDVVTIFSESADGEFFRVRTHEGIPGYILAADVSAPATHQPNLQAIDTLLPSFVNNTIHHAPRWSGGAINLVWEHANSQTMNYNRMQEPFHDSLMVVSPSWYHLDMNETSGMASFVSQTYIQWAHEQGVAVWPRVFDFNNTNAHTMLTDRARRHMVISQLAADARHYGFNGINIHFEHLSEMLGPYKIQFLRELAIATQDLDIVLSALVYVPADWSRFYRRDLIARTVDFVMVMTYNEHWNGSPVSGPMASLPWVRQALDNMLLEVPANQLIMGIPFHNRVWRERLHSGNAPETENWGIDYTRDFFNAEDVTWEWLEDIGSYYAYFLVVEGGATTRYRVWLEDERSIAAKMELFAQYNLAGIGGWRRLLESEGVWDVIEAFF